MNTEMYEITDRDTENVIETENISSVEKLRELMKYTSARIGIGHVGPRYKTKAYLRFLADQSAAADAVFDEVDRSVIDQLGVLEVSTKCRNKYEMLTRPDWGRIFEPETLGILSEKCVHDPDVQIYFGDGLCSPSIRANIPDVFSALKSGLEYEGISVGTPFFVRYCRVNTARTIGPLLGAKVVCVLIGERPGLLTAESMSAYITYKPHEDMQESEYNVVANISKHGIPPVEAAAHIVDLIKNILLLKCSGVEFNKKTEGKSS